MPAKNTRPSRRSQGRQPWAYKGPLAEPMYPPSVLGTLSCEEWAVKRAEKMALLFKHFGIDPNSKNAGMALANALAERHVPGFMPPPKRGRPKQNDDIKLALAIELLRERDGLGAEAAAEKIASCGLLKGTGAQIYERYKKRPQHIRTILEVLKLMAEKAVEADGSRRHLIEALEAFVETI